MVRGSYLRLCIIGVSLRMYWRVVEASMVLATGVCRACCRYRYPMDLCDMTMLVHLSDYQLPLLKPPSLQPKQITEIKEFLLTARRKDAKCTFPPHFYAGA